MDGKRELYSVVASMHGYSGRPSLFHTQLRAFLLVLSYAGYQKSKQHKTRTLTLQQYRQSKA